MSSRRLDTTIRGYRRGNVHKSYMRPKDAAEFYGYAKEHMMALASAAGAVYKLSDGMGKTTFMTYAKKANAICRRGGMTAVLWFTDYIKRLG